MYMYSICTYQAIYIHVHVHELRESQRTIGQPCAAVSDCLAVISNHPPYTHSLWPGVQKCLKETKQTNYSIQSTCWLFTWYILSLPFLLPLPLPLPLPPIPPSTPSPSLIFVSATSFSLPLSPPTPHVYPSPPPTFSSLNHNVGIYIFLQHFSSFQLMNNTT